MSGSWGDDTEETDFPSVPVGAEFTVAGRIRQQKAAAGRIAATDREFAQARPRSCKGYPDEER